MEHRKLTKEDIDKVRNIEGFPIGSDEDIIALSDAPYYTACPNPFIEDFIKEYGHPYDEKTDNYHREPFTADISEGKHDPFYMAHGYHTKVPFKAIMRYILNYTNPNDIVLDGFCGSGMTGVAAQMCGKDSIPLQQEMLSSVPNSKWGRRRAILSDLSPMASFISYNFNMPFDMQTFVNTANRIIEQLDNLCGWAYSTLHTDGVSVGNIEYTVWADNYICPSCGMEICYWDISVLEDNTLVKHPKCPQCGYLINKNNCARAIDTKLDKSVNSLFTTVKNTPVKIFYKYGGRRFSKKVDSGDIDTIDRIESMDVTTWFPNDEIPEGYNTSQPKKSHGINYVHQFYTKRNLYVLSECYKLINQTTDNRLKNILRFWFSSIYSRSHKCNRYMPSHNRHVGPLSGTLYIPFFQAEINIISLLKEKLKSMQNVFGMKNGDVLVTNQSTTDYVNIPNNSIDYIFTDPPFGDNLNYSELNMIWESWLKIKTNNEKEAVVNDVQKKELYDYQRLMELCFLQYYKVLKPNRWITVEFHNSKNAVWNSIQESLQKAGFVVADVRTLDKQKGTTKQLSNYSAVKQDLIISAYKTKTDIKNRILMNAGTDFTVWEFVRNHLSNLPIIVLSGNKLEIVPERQAFLLYDRMVAYHIMQGIPVPIDATDFYKGLDEKFLKRDDMYFLPDQVNEYDTARIKADVEPIQFSMFVTNEKSAIAWLYQQLDEKNGGPQNYADLQPKFMQEVKTVDRNEKMPELQTMLEENFLQDEKGRWYVPDITKEGDLAKLREKNLWKEFESYMNSTGKLKLFRSEAIRVGFSRLWKDKNYAAIVSIAERLPEKTIQEDQNLLMYYDISLGRV